MSVRQRILLPVTFKDSPENTCKIYLTVQDSVKPFNCVLCNKSFSEKGNLTVHQRIHTHERPYLCIREGCTSSFTSQGNLTNHENAHTGIRPFRCPSCDRSYSRKLQFKNHFKVHVHSLNCPSCDQSFPNKQSIVTHLIEIHLNLNFNEVSLFYCLVDPQYAMDFYSIKYYNKFLY